MIEALLSGMIGALLGALITPIFSEGLIKKRVLKEQKAQLLKELMATKFTGACDQRGAEAVNYIPVLFSGNERVLDKFRSYHDGIINNSNSLDKSFMTMIIAIAEDIGIKLDTVDMMRTPIVSHLRKLEDTRTLNELKKIG